jgi:hydrogenase maturation protease
VSGRREVVVIGIGNEFRQDDGAGLAVLARLAAALPPEAARPGVELLASDGDPAELLAAWAGARLAIVVDAMRGQPPVPGRRHRLDGGQLAALDQAGAGPWPASSHALGLAAAAGLAAALGQLPGRLIVHGVEVADVTAGTGLSPAVAAAIGPLAEAVLADIRAAGGAVPGTVAGTT